MTGPALPLPASPFPLRAGAIDVGSNALRLLIAEFADATRYSVLEQVRAPVRLGHDVFSAGRLSPGTIEAAVETLARYGRLLDAHAVHHRRAVATSAVRESSNRGLLEERARQVGVELEVITGAEEARLVHAAVRQRVDLHSGTWLLADLGGGSVEVSLVDHESIHWTESHEMGSVRLLEELSTQEEPPDLYRKLVEYTQRLSVPAVQPRPCGFIATGGNAEALARICGSTDEHDVSTVLRAELHALALRLGSMSASERAAEYDLRADRADVILPAAVVYERLAAQAGFDTITVPHVGVKDGVAVDLVDDLTRHSQHGAHLEVVVYNGALSLGRRYAFDEPHARHVTRLALVLFDQLTALHGLAAADRRLLTAAALLHDVGTFIAYRRHHKHSLYIIAQSELPGFSPPEIQLVANIARYHRKSEPGEGHDAFMALAAADRERVRRLAGMLRIADALDREHIQNVRDIAAVDDGAAVLLRTSGSGDLLLERWAIDRKRGLFERVFDRTVLVPGTTADQ